MTIRSIVLIGLASFAVAAPAVAGRAPQHYRVDGPAVPAGLAGDGAAINAQGTIVGRIDVDAFAWDGTTLRRFPPVKTTYFDGTYVARATAVNARGDIVGHDGNSMPCSMSGLELAAPAVFRAGATVIVGGKGACSYEIDGINDAGVMVGIHAYRGFVRYPDGGEIEIRPLSTRPENNGTRASAIDNEGDVVGGTTIDVPPPRQIPMGQEQIGFDGPMKTIFGPDPNAYVVHAFLARFAGGTQHMRDLGALPGFPDTYATAISEDRVVVGYSGTNSGPKWTRVGGPSHAWVWQAGRMTDLGAGTAADSFAYGVNDAGTIVGCSGDNAVLWLDKKRYDLRALVVNAQGWQLTCAHGINRAGQIVGTGVHDGQVVPFRLTPVR